MTETVGKEIMLEGVDPRELYGAQDVYLEQIKSLHLSLIHISEPTRPY